MDLGLTDRVYIVTAASAGLGRATAEQLVAEGAQVVLAARRGDVLAEAVRELGPQHATSVTVDLADPSSARTCCAAALNTFGRLDGAMISVGGPPAGTVLGTSEEDWTDAFASVFLPALRISKAVLAHGTSDNISLAWVLSTSVKSPIGGLAISNGLRPGLAMTVKQLADEIGPDGHRAVGLMPGRIETERVKHLDSLAEDPQSARASAEAGIPMRRYGNPAEFGRIATFVLSPAASYLTGAVIPVDGGALRAL
ncbi:MAG: SDR family oxidoreductase [Propionibacteriaceae bacterium]